VREDDGRKLDHATLEAIRMRAVRAVRDGEHPAEVAKTLGMTRAAVYAWLAQARAGGPEALRAKQIPGRPPKLSGPQLHRVYELVVGSDPRQLRFPFALWTREMVQELIHREFGVALSLSSVGRLLRRLGLTPPAAPVPGLPGGPGGGHALEGRGVPHDPRGGGGGGCGDLLRR
jgi:transposase